MCGEGGEGGGEGQGVGESGEPEGEGNFFLEPKKQPLSQQISDILAKTTPATAAPAGPTQAEKDAAAFEEDLAKFTAAQSAARGGAFDRANTSISRLGLDPNTFAPDLNAELDRIVRGQTGPVAGVSGFADPSAAFEDDIASIVLDRNRDISRRNFEREIDAFGGEGFALNSIGNDADDAILQSILNPQYEDANTTLQNAFSVGNLSRAGLDRALTTLGEQRTSALSNLDRIGGDVLSQGRTDLRDIRDRGLKQARSFELGQSFAPADIQGRLDTTLGDFNRNLEGNIRGAVGDSPLFDVNRILANTRQTAFNPAAGTGDTAAPGLLATLSDRDKKRTETRGVGNTGAF